MSRLGPRLKELRRGRKLTQREVATAIGVPDTYVSRWETGRNVPERYTLQLLAEFYDVPVDDLMDLRDRDEADSDGRRSSSRRPAGADGIGAVDVPGAIDLAIGRPVDGEHRSSRGRRRGDG